jgi:hypothetical protein
MIKTSDFFIHNKFGIRELQQEDPERETGSALASAN